MSLDRIATFLDMQEAFREKASTGNAQSDISDAEKTAVKRLLNQYYLELSSHKEYQWRATTRFFNTTAKYTTGTVSVTDGSKIIEFSAAVTIDSTFIGRTIRVGSDMNWYKIVAVHDAANRKAMLSNEYTGTTDTAATYEIYKPTYGLWPDYDDEIKLIYTSGGGDYLPETTGFAQREYNAIGPTPITPQEYLELLQANPFQTATRPVYYTIMGQADYEGEVLGSEFITGYDFMENNNYKAVDTAIHFYPMIFDETSIAASYVRIVEALVNDEDKPLLPMKYRMIPVFGALQEWFSTKTHDMRLAGFYAAKYAEGKAMMEGQLKDTQERARLIPRSRRTYKVGY